MNRDQATRVLRELASDCQPLADAVTLMTPNADDVLSHGYQLQIKATESYQEMACIKGIATKHNLAVSNQQPLIVIYRPMNDNPITKRYDQIHHL